MKKLLLSLVAFATIAVSGLALAGGNELAYFKIPELGDLARTSIASGDYVPVYDASASKTRKVPADQFGVGPSAEDVTATNVITTVECGKTFFLNSATEFVSTLPAPTLGCKLEFFIKAAPSGANYTIVTNAGADVIVIEVNELETDTNDDGPYDDNADVITFVGGVSDAGDSVACNSDGTKWYCRGTVQNDGALTTGTT